MREKDINDKAPEMALYLIKLPYISEIEVASFGSEQAVNSGDWVVAETRYGVDLVQVVGVALSKKHYDEQKRHQGKIIRLAQSNDFDDRDKNSRQAALYEKICKDKINYRKLPMKLIKVHILLNNSKVLVFFTAEQRVDFRDLVRDLVSQFHTRIELRQIGVRDETRTLGGLAVCGREYCCKSINDHNKPATIKMVKDQDLSINSSKISGGCGRLLCCLSYEHDTYEHARKKLPTEYTKIRLNNILYTVSNVYPLTNEVMLLNSEDMAAKPLRYDASNLIKNTQGEWVERDNKQSLTRKKVITSCGCTRTEGTRCNGCSAGE